MIREVISLHFQNKQSARKPTKSELLLCQVTLEKLTLKQISVNETPCEKYNNRHSQKKVFAGWSTQLQRVCRVATGFTCQGASQFRKELSCYYKAVNKPDEPFLLPSEWSTYKCYMLCIQILFNYSNYHIRCQRTNISCLEFSLKSSIFHVS